ncbi:hypothetical protein P154DRAFT_395527, partial [Amniculicola lignicola CBS 123094]
LTARKLKRVHGMRSQGTNDMRKHLSLYPETKIVRLYHHSSSLKEYLLVTNESGRIDGDSILRQLALETLDSLQKVLFPLDHKSMILLKSMVLIKNWDPDCVECNSIEYRREDEKEIRYHYLSDRLMALFGEAENRRPHGTW